MVFSIKYGGFPVNVPLNMGHYSPLHPITEPLQHPLLVLAAQRSSDRSVGARLCHRSLRPSQPQA